MIPARIVLAFLTIFVVLFTEFHATPQQPTSAAKVKNHHVPPYLMQLYSKLTKKNSRKKLPFQATTVRGIFFTSVKRITSHSVKLSVDLGYLGTGQTVMKDELNLFIVNNNTQVIQNYTILIKDSSKNELIALKHIRSQIYGWQRVSLGRWLQKWLDNHALNNGLWVSLKTNHPKSSSNQLPTIDTTWVNQPYLIIYLSQKKQVQKKSSPQNQTPS